MSNVFAKNPSQQIDLHQIENVGLGSNLATSLSPLQSIPLGRQDPTLGSGHLFHRDR
jgi:hypothetical protein